MQNGDFLTVGIGASAGGIQALKRFFEHVPADSGAAYVVVLHLSPEHESRLAEVLQVSAAIPVSQVRQRVRVEPNHVYVIPPDRTLSMHDAFLTVSQMGRFEDRRAPVDMFFRTLAESQGTRAVCVVLSGTGANGSMGLKRIKEQGGLCLAQDPEEAEHSDMPRHAIATKLVDDVLPVAEMPSKILAYRQSAASIRLPDAPPAGPAIDEQTLRDLFVLLRSQTGHDFSNYKRGTILRRIGRRMSLHEVAELADYVRLLRADPEEAQALLKDLLISVTNLFRDPEAFGALERLVVPKLFGRGDAARQLEEELERLRSQLRSSLEQHEAQAEELRASNEELQAMNEELRSSAEELETSKEELQSLNEELRTVNQELKIKIEEQAQAADDIRNLIVSTEIGTIFLDRTFCIKLFTPRARDIFTLIPADHGRPLSDISSSLMDVDFQADMEQVLERLERVEREVRTRDGRWHLMRVLPYRTTDNRIEGVVMTFVDITGRKRAEEAWRGSQERLRLVVESVPDHAIFTLDPDGRVDSWNSGAARLFGYTEVEIIGQPGAIVFTADDQAARVPQQELQLALQTGRAFDERWHVRKDGSRFYASGAVAPLRLDERTVTGFVKIAHDLTERKRWEDTLQQARVDLEARVQERTSALAHANLALDAELRQREQTEEHIRDLLRRLISVQEDERRRIARDLHDQIGQELAGLSLRIESLHAVAANDPAGLPAAFEEVRAIITRLDRELDFVAWELRPAALDDLGLVVSLDHFVREWSRQFGLTAEFHSKGFNGVRLQGDIETNLYRIAQEALNNVYKHARAKRVGVLLERRSGEAVLVIEDDGVGFEPGEPEATSGRASGVGLLGMRERAAVIGGTLELESQAGQGTTVFVRVPLPAGEGAPRSAEL